MRKRQFAISFITFPAVQSKIPIAVFLPITYKFFFRASVQRSVNLRPLVFFSFFFISSVKETRQTDAHQNPTQTEQRRKVLVKAGGRSYSTYITPLIRSSV